MIFKSFEPQSNAERIDRWREKLLCAMPDLTEEQQLRREYDGLGLRRAWNARFGRAAAERSAHQASKPLRRPFGTCEVHVLRRVAAA